MGSLLLALTPDLCTCDHEGTCEECRLWHMLSGLERWEALIIAIGMILAITISIIF